MEDRYVYIGSKMKPPCETYINWTVLRKVYPIDPKYVTQIRWQLLKHKDELKADSNIRGLRKVNGHEIIYIGASRLLLGYIALAIVSLFIL